MASDPKQQRQFVRFSASQRMEHVILLVSMVGLAATGLPQRQADVQWAKTLIDWMGGIESVRITHRFMAILLMLDTIYHGGALSYKFHVLGARATMVPKLRDLSDIRDWVFYNLGLKKEHPRFPRYNFGEKAEYLAVIWGTLLMGITGFMMWNPIATTKLLPGVAIPVARAAHSAEAVLAVLSIMTWHTYNVHFRRFNRSMFTGRLSYDAMKEEHGEELEAIERGELRPRLPRDILVRRRRQFWPYAVVMTVILLTGAYLFVTFEDTAITTVPRQDIVVLGPQGLPETGDANVGAVLWPTLRCARCHGDDADGSLGIPSLLDTPLSFDDFYRQVREGGAGMPAFGAEAISDANLLHIWAWLRSSDEP